MKPGVPVVTGAQAPAALRVLPTHAARSRRPLARPRPRLARSRRPGTASATVTRPAASTLPHPSLPGRIQLDNAGIAIAALRATSIPADPTGLARAEWPARLQRLHGSLPGMLPPQWELWLDGGHNPGAGIALADHLRDWADRPVHLVVGMKQAKDSAEFLRPLLPLATTVWAVREPNQHAALPLEAIIAASNGIARPGPGVRDALREISGYPGPARVLICGSLYLAGEVLQLDH